MEIDIVIYVDSNSGLVSPVEDDDSDDESDPNSASSPSPMQKYHESQNEKMTAI